MRESKSTFSECVMAFALGVFAVNVAFDTLDDFMRFLLVAFLLLGALEHVCNAIEPSR